MSDLAVTWCLLKWIFLTINVSPSWCPAPPDHSPSLPAHLRGSLTLIKGGQTLMLINLIFLLVPSLGGQRKCWCWWYFNSSFAQCGWSSAIPDYDKCPSLWCWLLPNWGTVEDWGLAWKCCQLEKMLVGLLCFIFRVWPDSLNLFNPLDLRQSSPSPSP